jgi:adenylate cyclase
MATTPRESTSLLIAFIDLSRFTVQSQRVEDAEIADVLDSFYERVARAVTSAGGRTVKFIGDAAFVVFPEQAVDVGVRALLELRDDVDRSMAERGWECRFSAKAHFGTAIAGDFGPENDRRFDVVGRAVNTAAMLRSTGITLSAEAFHQLSSELRPSFKEQPAPVTYVALEKHD